MSCYSETQWKEAVRPLDAQLPPDPAISGAAGVRSFYSYRRPAWALFSVWARSPSPWGWSCWRAWRRCSGPPWRWHAGSRRRTHPSQRGCHRSCCWQHHRPGSGPLGWAAEAQGCCCCGVAGPPLPLAAGREGVGSLLVWHWQGPGGDRGCRWHLGTRRWSRRRSNSDRLLSRGCPVPQC